MGILMKKVHKSHKGKAVQKKDGKKLSKSVRTDVQDQSPYSGKKSEKTHRPGQFVPGDPRINRTKPGPGRPPGKFARKCRRVLASKKTWGAVRRTLKNENSQHFKGMWSEVANRGYGRQVSAGIQIDLPNSGGMEEPGENNNVSAIVLLMGRLDQMEKRKEKAKGHLKEA